MSDLSFERLPPTVLSPTAREAVAAVDGSKERPSPATRWYGQAISEAPGGGWLVHLYAEPFTSYVACGADVAGIAAGSNVIVGFFDDLSVSIVAVV